MMLIIFTESRSDEEEQEPKPKYDVDLLVNNVEGHNAERIMLLERSTRTILVKGAFCHL